MTQRDPKFDAYVLQIHSVLDRLDYYRLLGVDAHSDVAAVKKAYRKIAAKFHPDRNRDAAPQIQQAIYAIFKRLNEAYRVLCDPDRRNHYNQHLAEGNVRLETDVRMSTLKKEPEDTIVNREARQFYLQAKEALAKGNLLHAELHLKVAASREGENDAIAELARTVIEAKKSK